MKVVKIGRYIDNDVVINDRTVERSHIQITRHDDGHYTLLNLQSSNGTFVNGKCIVGEVELHYDDVIKIGNTTLRWEDYFPDDEREKLRRELEALKKESCPPPPYENACCYCPAPLEWEDKGTPILPISINDPVPIVILFGPRDCGKTMTLIRLTRYLETQAYWVEPNRLFRPSYDEHYKSVCENYIRMCYSDYAPGGNINYMLVKVRDRSGRPVCQIVKLPGELCFDPHSSAKTPPFNFLIKQLLDIPNRRIWVFMTELDWGDSKTRSTYATYMNKLLPSIRKDQIILTCNKVDDRPESLLPDYRPNIKQLFKNVRDQYPNIFNLLENKKSIIRVFKKWNFDFVPFSSGEFTLTGDDRVCYIPSPDYYPRILWKAIIKALRNNGKSEIGILGILALAILGYTIIGLLITHFLL